MAKTVTLLVAPDVAKALERHYRPSTLASLAIRALHDKADELRKVVTVEMRDGEVYRLTGLPSDWKWRTIDRDAK
jgi:Flp pilus assembly protein CpaB